MRMWGTETDGSRFVTSHSLSFVSSLSALTMERASVIEAGTACGIRHRMSCTDALHAEPETSETVCRPKMWLFQPDGGVSVAFFFFAPRTETVDPLEDPVNSRQRCRPCSTLGTWSQG